MTNSRAQDLIDHAALSGPFRPDRFLYGANDPEDRSVLLRALAPCCEEVTVDGVMHWNMRNSDRTRILRSLSGKSATWRRLWRKRPPLKGDMFARVLRDCLTGKALDPDRYKGDDLRRAISAAIFAGAMVTGSRKDQVKAFETALYQSAVSAARAARFRAVLPHPLCGRDPERAAILAFLERGEIRHPARSTGTGVSDTSARRLLLTGSPGMGKSAFLADIGQRIADRHDAAPCWVVVFDFDQLTLTRGSVIAWAEELTRQIGSQHPAIGGDLSAIRARHARARSDATTVDTESAAAALLADVWNILRSQPPRPMIIIADTIEEITAQDPIGQFEKAPQDTLFHQLINWSAQLGAIGASGDEADPFGDIRILASGRTEPPVGSAVLAGWFDTRLELPELDDDAAVRMLHGLDASLNRDVCRRIVTAVGGHPLHLILVQKHLSTLEAAERPALLKELEEKGLRGAGSKFVIQTLYSRFLNRFRVENLQGSLSLEDLKKLAHPGLLLRQVTAQLLLEVVAPAVGVDLADLATANQALDALREQVWMVTAGDEPGSVRHRPDVRRVMVPLMRDTSSPIVAKVLDRAIAWYDQRSGPRSREEAGYLRALRGDAGDIDVFVNDPALAASVLSVIGADLMLMPVESIAILKYHSSARIPLSEAELKALPEDLQIDASLRQQSEALKTYGGQTFTHPPVSPEASAPRQGSRGDGLDWIPTVTNAYDLLNDQRLDNAVEVAFVESDFEEAARIGWTAISRIRTWPDLSEPLGLRQDFHESWLWRTALASTVAPPPPDRLAHLPGPEAIIGARQILRRQKGPDPLAAAVHDLEALTRLASQTSELRNVESIAHGFFKDRTITISDFREMRMLAASPFLQHAVFGSAGSLNWSMITGAVPALATAFADIGGDRLESAGADDTKKKVRTELVEFLMETVRHHDLTGLQDLVDRIETQLDQVSLESQPGHYMEFPIDLGEPRLRQALGLYLRGQTPELHVTLMTSLMRLHEDDLIPAVSEIAAQVPVWPERLNTRLLQSTKMGGRSKAPVIQRLIGFIDLCGLLPDFVKNLAEKTQAPDLVAQSRLLTRLDELWRLPTPEDFPPA